jgi:hypothetical protein
MYNKSLKWFWCFIFMSLWFARKATFYFYEKSLEAENVSIVCVTYLDLTFVIIWFIELKTFEVGSDSVAGTVPIIQILFEKMLPSHQIDRNVQRSVRNTDSSLQTKCFSLFLFFTVINVVSCCLIIHFNIRIAKIIKHLMRGGLKEMENVFLRNLRSSLICNFFISYPLEADLTHSILLSHFYVYL